MSQSKCENCDHACQTVLGAEGECLGNLTHQEREALAFILIAQALDEKEHPDTVLGVIHLPKVI